ncbi:MAG: methyltransferase domain-containing protein, partial [Proteobacteria bacterium]|nr:methyltransferase domain-containing protein [Pseudomonadota bacterium]
LINCPFCKRPVKTKLIADFYFCDVCEIAVRNERDMPQLGINIYDTDWVGSQENAKANLVRASYALKHVRKLYGIMTVLDVGCGTGILVNTLNRNGYIADGIDTSAEAIEFAKTTKRGNFYCSS